MSEAGASGGGPARRDPGEVTLLLRGGARPGEVLALVYDELRGLAEARMQAERPGHTLQATALVHEVVLRLSRERSLPWRDRRHLFGAAAEAMRRVLVDHARRVRSAKRGGDRARLELTLTGLAAESDPEMVLALDEALESLVEEDPRAGEVARLVLFAGLSSADVALALDVTARTVQRDWAYARARLTQYLRVED